MRFSPAARLGIVALTLFLLFGCRGAIEEISAPTFSLTTLPNEEAEQVWPVVAPLAMPGSLRPCCAFGYNLKVSLFGIPVPFFYLDNIADNDDLGRHQYNDTMLTSVAYLSGLGGEKLEILYTTQGGFIDIAHVRDTADNTLFLFSHIIRHLGEEKTLFLKSEWFERRIQLKSFAAPDDPLERYTLAAYLAGYLAYQLAAWHEVAQWYGYTSVPGFSEAISAFSPEDLYSNVLGARLAISLILQGRTDDIKRYNAAMEAILPDALTQLGAVSRDETKARFDQIDGKWWSSGKRIPDKYVVLYRNYDLSAHRRPELPEADENGGLTLALPDRWSEYQFSDLAELQLWPDRRSARFSNGKSYLTISDAQNLALLAEQADKQPQ